jgi:hypothetical protein
VCPDKHYHDAQKQHSYFLRDALNSLQSSCEIKCSAGYKTHPLKQHKTPLVISGESLLQLAVPRYRAAVCCCLPALGNIDVISSGVTHSKSPHHNAETEGL